MEKTFSDKLSFWLGRATAYILLTGVAVLLLFPLIYMIIASLKTTVDFNSNPRRLLPYTHVTEAITSPPIPVYEFNINGRTERFLISRFDEENNEQVAFSEVEGQVVVASDSEAEEPKPDTVTGFGFIPTTYIDENGQEVRLTGDVLTLESTNQTIELVGSDGEQHSYLVYDVLQVETPVQTWLPNLGVAVPLKAYLTPILTDGNAILQLSMDTAGFTLSAEALTQSLSPIKAVVLDVFVDPEDASTVVYASAEAATRFNIDVPLYEFQVDGEAREFQVSRINANNNDKSNFAYLGTLDDLQTQVAQGSHAEQRRNIEVLGIIPIAYVDSTGQRVDLESSTLTFLPTNTSIRLTGNDGIDLDFSVYDVLIDDDPVLTRLESIYEMVPLHAYLRPSVATENTPVTVSIGDTVSLADKDASNRDYATVTVTADGQTDSLVWAYNAAIDVFFEHGNPQNTIYAIEAFVKPVEVIEFQLVNYEAALGFSNDPSLRMDRALVNTVIVTILVTIGQMTTSLFGGYAFSRMQFRGRDALFLVYLGSIMIPFVVLIVPIYRLMTALGWENHLVSLIVPWIFTAYGTFLIRQFFVSIPKELEEAALLDGCGRFKILWRIFIPLSTPALATHAIFTFLYAWNSFLWPLLIIGEGNTANHVLTLSMIRLRNVFADQPNLVLTGAAVAILPPIIIFILAQRYFIEGVASSGVKG